MEQTTAYKASDGELFHTIDQCQEYEHSLIWQQRVNEFIASKHNVYSGAQAGIVRRSILAWEMFKVENK